MKLHLFIDADDTLWENNVFFERAFDEFVAILDHSALTPDQVRASLDEIEHVNNRLHGYGSANFARNLVQCLQHLSERGVSTADLERIARLEQDLVNHPMELLPGVEETLVYLKERHHLVLCTKGNPQEQRAKLDRSGLEPHFHEVEVVKEKNAELYRTLIAVRDVPGEGAWMIGNSPKSDINASLRAGLGAVYVPHPHTWHLEHESVPEHHERLLVIGSFREITGHF